MNRGFGVAAGLDPEVARPLRRSLRGAGLRTRCWSNDHPGREGPGDAGRVRRRGAGPRPRRRRDRARPHPAGEDRRRHREVRYRPARLWLGVGAGFSEKPLTGCARSLPASCARALPGVRLVLAAMGPKMCALAGASYDGAFFNWMTPEFAAGAREQVEAGAADAGRADAAGLRLRPHRRRPRRRRAPRQGGVLLPRPPPRLPQPLRPPRRARGHRRRRRRRRATTPSQALAAYTALDTAVVRGLAAPPSSNAGCRAAA